MLLKIEKKGGGLPLLAAALSACPADCHPGLDPGGQHLATCCLVRMATKVGSPFLLASKTSFCTPSPKGLRPLKPPTSLLPSLKNSVPAQPAPHAHMAVPECSLCGQSFAVALAQTRFKVFDFIVVNAFLGIFHILFVLRHRFSLGHAPHALILLLKFLVI
jgi:hypothetical protein